MDQSPNPKLDSDVSEPTSSTQTSKKRKVVEKTVVTVRIGANAGKLKNEGPPSDFWSWRKYGQKPIKGSPFPRGYYRCSTSKGCTAKKMVERCRTDSSMLIITYTSTHNHPGPDIHNTTNLNPPQEEEPETQPSNEDHLTTPNQYQQLQDQEVEKQNQLTLTTNEEDASETHNFHYIQSPIRGSEDIIINQEDPFIENQEKTELDTVGILLDEEPISCQRLMTLSAPKSEENDFFDELEELPTYSAFRSLMRSTFFDEGIPVVPS